MKRISPNRIIDAVDENFKDVLSKPRLKTLALIAVAISLAKKLKINQIARKTPTDVKHQKAKQTIVIQKKKCMFEIYFSRLVFRYIERSDFHECETSQTIA